MVEKNNAVMQEKEILFMLKLLEDPDVKVFEAIRKKLIQNAKIAVPLLESYWTVSDNSLANNRCDEILEQIHFSTIKKRLLNWKETGKDDLLTGILIVEKFFNKSDDTEQIKSGIDSIVSRIWIEVNEQLTALEKIKLINHFLFNLDAYTLIETPIINQHDADLAQVLKLKAYLDKSISVIYRIIAQKLNIPLYILRFETGTYSILGYIDEVLSSFVMPANMNNIVFFLLPALKGNVLSQNQLYKLLEKEHIKLSSYAMIPKSNYEIVSDWVKYKYSLYSQNIKSDLLLKNTEKLLKILK
jgi:regulator of sirC expression with transglutaminase-like and TPR domain